MNVKFDSRPFSRWLAAAMGLAAGAYATHAGITWSTYGHAPVPSPEEEDALLDRFMPVYEVVERHHLRIAAPAALVLASARDVDLFRSYGVRAIFKARELLLGATPDHGVRPGGLLIQVQSLGWGLLAEVPGRELVVGALTRPWEANVTFRALPPEEFAAFCEPGYVKIVWTLRVDPISASHSIFRTETRVMTTDSTARAKFRRYWSCFSPGIVLIRWISLRSLRRQAERRAREGG
jgi:hypothetical protein